MSVVEREELALYLRSYNGKIQYAVRAWLRDKHPQDYVDFLDCHPGKGQALLAMQDLQEYFDVEYQEAVAAARKLLEGE